MWVLTVIDDSTTTKFLEFNKRVDAVNVQIALIENGCVVNRYERVI